MPFHDAPTYAMRWVHESRGNRYGFVMLAEVGERRRILGSEAGLGLARLGGVAVCGDAAGSPSHLIGVLGCGGAAGCSDAGGAGPMQPADQAPYRSATHLASEGGSRFRTTGSLTGADQGRGKGADQCCSADAKKEFLGQAHSLGF